MDIIQVTLNPLETVESAAVFGHSTICHNSDGSKKIYVFGGFQDSRLQYPVPSDLVYEYDIILESWRSIYTSAKYFEKPKPVAFHVATLYEDGRIL